jgi:hypothetical protein
VTVILWPTIWRYYFNKQIFMILWSRTICYFDPINSKLFWQKHNIKPVYLLIYLGMDTEASKRIRNSFENILWNSKENEILICNCIVSITEYVICTILVKPFCACLVINNNVLNEEQNVILPWHFDTLVRKHISTGHGNK